MMACDFAALTERLRRSAVQVISGNGGGSGVVWDATGVVVTNAQSYPFRPEACEAIAWKWSTVRAEDFRRL